MTTLMALLLIAFMAVSLDFPIIASLAFIFGFIQLLVSMGKIWLIVKVKKIWKSITEK